ncbi:DUF4397 domain-containing protein [Nocardioides sp. LHG3406-4]|uniref:DUF4397 domain-containing protein n=1 Tax=Nocardioides sp. LHG3406-4 TaxID=2804575 RepID=UPI003CF2F4DB
MKVRRILTALAVAVVATTVSAPVSAAPSAAGGSAPPAASVFVIQGVTGSTWSITLDDEELSAAAGPKDILGPVKLAAGSHTVTATDPGGAEVTATVEVESGESLDVVLHRPVDPTGRPLFTTFENDLAPVKAGSGRVTVAHTASAPPADIRVNGEVLLADVASAEEITAVVPTGVYPVDIVPAATDGPVVLGPVDLEVAGSALTRVFAVGVAADQTMDAIVQVLPVQSTDATVPTSVPAGDGSMAAAADATSPIVTRPGVWLLLGGAALVALGMRRLRRH